MPQRQEQAPHASHVRRLFLPLRHTLHVLHHSTKSRRLRRSKTASTIGCAATERRAPSSESAPMRSRRSASCTRRPRAVIAWNGARRPISSAYTATRLLGNASVLAKVALVTFNQQLEREHSVFARQIISPQDRAVAPKRLPECFYRL